MSVTQAFNTTTSMGRLTLNVLLSFAQFEREVTGERIRDKIVASKKKGLWMGGQPSLGYDVKERKLVVNVAEAAAVRRIFRRYLELGSVRALKATLDQEGVVSKLRAAADGSPYGGKSFSRGALYLMLQNRVYRGEIVHKGPPIPANTLRSLTKTYGRGSSAVSKPTASTGETSERRARRISDRDPCRRGRPTHDADPLDQKRRPISVLRIAPPHHRDEGRRGKRPSNRSAHSGGQSGTSCRSATALILRRSGRRSRVLPRCRRDAPSQRLAKAAATEIVRALDDQREDAWNMNFRPMIVRVRVGLDRIDVELSAERLVGRLLQTSNDVSGPGKGDHPPPCGNSPIPLSPSFGSPRRPSSNGPAKK